MHKSFFSVWMSIFLIGNLIPNFVFAQIPNDPHAEQWAFKDIGAYRAWDINTGSRSVVVAVIDNGFDSNHPDLKDNVWKNPREIVNNNIDDDNNGYIDDITGWNFVPFDKNGDGKIKGDEKKGNNNPVPNVSGLSKTQKEKGFFNHATLVAGLIGAVGNNKKDMAGLNWKVSLMNLKVLDNTGTGDYTPLSQALRYAVDNGADIINISAVGTNSSDLDKTIDYASSKGVVIVAAAGNNAGDLNDSPLYPACSDAGVKLEKQKILGVSAINEAHRLAEFSSFGSDCVDITAPGVHVGSLLRYEPSEGLKKEWSDGWNGTSFATPLVSGAAALVKAIQPGWKAPQIYQALLKNTHKTPPKNESEYQNYFGYGLLQVDKAVQYAVDRLPVAQVLKSLGLFDASTGFLETLSLDKQISSSTQAFLRKTTLLKAFKNSGETEYLTMRLFQGNNQMTVYSQNWQKLFRWNMPSDVTGKIFVGKFLNDGDAQVVVVPAIDSDSVVVFSLDGKKLATHQIHVHGKNIIAAHLLSGQQLAVVSKENGKTFLQIFDSAFMQKQDLALPSVGSISQIANGDSDGDKKQEYIVLSQKGVNATVSIIDEKGKLVRQFPVSNTAVASDIQLVVGDFTGDKKDDILTIEKNATSIVVWKNTGEIIDRIPFIAQQNQIFSFIPIM